MRRAFAIVLVILLAAVVAVAWWRVSPSDATADAATAARWVDETQCGQCHREQVHDWRESHHHLAMQLPTATSVRGDFSDQRLRSDTQTSLFFRKGEEFWVRTHEADGEAVEHQVAYTFGWEPLQQYLLETEEGKWQVHGAAWDTQKQAWFHLYDGEAVDQTHRLHWRQPAQNANFMCIECHVSAFERNYDAERERFASDWQALGVGCQSCHGPASRHLQWAESGDERAGRGFERPLTDAARASQVETCARCHSRRSPLGDGETPGARLRDDYRVSGLTAELYEVDGTIHDEVFEYGSFVQSRMYAAGVVCSDCHNAHSGELRAPGNAVCMQCHGGDTPTRAAISGEQLRAGDYDSPAHHHHAEGSPGAQCRACHMPGKVYMGNDRRHDHSFSSPDPAQALALGHDDACLGCHTGDKPDTLVEQFKRWYPDHQPRDGGYARALYKARHGEAGAAAALFGQLERDDLPAMRRAALLAELPSYPSDRARRAVLDSVNDDAAAVREATVPLLAALLEPGEMVTALQPLLTDPVRAVRLEAAWQWLQVNGGERRAARPPWVEEYETVQRSLLDRADAHFNLASLYSLTGRPDLAEPALREALRRDAGFFPAIIALAQWREQQGEAGPARAALRQAIARHPDEASLHHALGLALVRAGRHQQALPEFESAHRLAPDNAGYAYVLAVALHNLDQSRRALDLLRRQVRAHPGERSLRLALLRLLAGRPDSAAEIQTLLGELREQNPWDPVLQR